MRGHARRATYHRNSTHSLEVVSGLPGWVSYTFAQTLHCSYRAVRHEHGSDIRGIPPWNSFRPYATETEGRVEIESEWTARSRERSAGRLDRKAFSPSGSY